MTFVAAFDLATATGVADGRVGDAAPRLWTWYLDDSGGERPARLAHLDKFLAAYFDKFKPDVVVYERPLGIAAIAGMMKNKIFITNEKTLGLLRGAIGVLEARACAAGVPQIIDVGIQEARKHLCGQARFPEGGAKAATIRACRALGWAPEDDNQADAAALWSLTCGRNNPRIAAALGRAYLAAKEDQTIVRRPKKEKGAGPLFQK